jgi:hypothetical protein
VARYIGSPSGRDLPTMDRAGTRSACGDADRGIIQALAGTDVVFGVGHDQDGGICRLPFPGFQQSFDDPAELGGGTAVAATTVPSRTTTSTAVIQHRRPRRAAGLPRGHERVQPAWDELRGGLGSAIDVAEPAFGRGRSFRAQSWGHIPPLG